MTWINPDHDRLAAEALEAVKNAPVYEITEEQVAEAELVTLLNQRMNAYPPLADFADAWVKNDEVALEEYRQACLAVKAKYPKPSA